MKKACGKEIIMVCGCGGKVSLLNYHPEDGQKVDLLCCGEAMKPVEAKTADFKTEKHVPVVSALDAGSIKVVVGSTPHPMTEEHHIEWIEVVDGPYVFRKYLNPGEPAEAVFPIPFREDLIAREYCNIHGLWAR